MQQPRLDSPPPLRPSPGSSTTSPKPPTRELDSKLVLTSAITASTRPNPGASKNNIRDEIAQLNVVQIKRSPSEPPKIKQEIEDELKHWASVEFKFEDSNADSSSDPITSSSSSSSVATPPSQIPSGGMSRRRKPTDPGRPPTDRTSRDPSRPPEEFDPHPPREQPQGQTPIVPVPGIPSDADADALNFAAELQARFPYPEGSFPFPIPEYPPTVGPNPLGHFPGAENLFGPLHPQPLPHPHSHPQLGVQVPLQHLSLTDLQAHVHNPPLLSPPVVPGQDVTAQLPWMYDVQAQHAGLSPQSPTMSPPQAGLSSSSTSSAVPTPGSSSKGKSGRGRRDASVSMTPEEVAIAEDKRRRNTEASSRFRIKKKQRMQQLEHTVSELEERVDELEKEAVSLRRENAWLKEIVILRSRTTLGPRIAEAASSQAGPSTTQSVREEEEEEEESVPGPREEEIGNLDDEDEEMESDDGEADDEALGGSKGKGKARER